jgi:hypothetical protein
MNETRTYFYFEACGFVSESFEAADLESAIDHVEASFRNPARPDFDGDDGGILGYDTDFEEWDCLTTFVGDTDHNSGNAERLHAAIAMVTGPDAPTPGAA